MTEELAPLSLFCSSVDDETKEEIRLKLLQETPEEQKRRENSSSRFGSGHGKPIMPKVTEAMIQGGLSQFVNKNSKSFFVISRISD